MREIINQFTIKTIVNRFLEFRKKRIERKINENHGRIKRFVSFNLSH